MQKESQTLEDIFTCWCFDIWWVWHCGRLVMVDGWSRW